MDHDRLALLERRLSTALPYSENSMSNEASSSMVVEGSDDDQGRKRSKINFTTEEDDKIMQGVDKFGPKNWQTIVDYYKLDRTPDAVRSRYKRRLCKDSPTSPSKPPIQTVLAFTVQNSPGGEKRPKVKRQRTESGFDASLGLRNEIKQLEDQVRSLRKEVVDLCQKNREKDDEVKLLERQIQRYDVQDNLIQRYREAMHAMQVEAARKEAREARMHLMDECARLGYWEVERSGAEFKYNWREGQGFLKIRQQLNAIQEQKESIEKMKKEASKRKLEASKRGEELSESSNQEDFWKLRLLSLKKEDQETMAERDRLQSQKVVFQKELKRIEDEDNSRFNTYPTLKDGRYLLLRLLGKGGFSEVYKAYDLHEARIVACKIHQLNPEWKKRKKEDYSKRAVREYQIHKRLDDPRVVKLHDVFEIDDNSFCTVLQYCDGNDLDRHLKLHRRLPEKEARVLISQIFEGLRYMNQQKPSIIHYDLKPGNILFHSDGIKITDFGLSKMMEDTQAEAGLELTSQGAGTYWYLPPECFDTSATPMISSKVDVWAAGVIFYQMLYGKKPFGDNISQQRILRENIISQANEVAFPAKPAVSDDAKAFIKRCLTPRQSLRPDVLEAAKDPYLRLQK